MAWTRRTRRIVASLAVLGLLGAGGAGTFWWKFLAAGEQRFADATERFHYGSLGAELLAGLPYPVFMVLPRVFPDLVARHAAAGYGPDKAVHGGYGAFGLAWEQGRRLPVGLSIKQRGFPRVTVNCALCHTTVYRLAGETVPRQAVGGPAHTLNLQGLLRFLFDAAGDRRFTAARLLPEIALQFELDALDHLLYATVIIPKTRLALRLAEREMGWMETRPAWGPGRDDAFNLPKFLLTRADWDDSVGNTDFPALWRLGERRGLLHWGGEAGSLRAVVLTSALGVGVPPGRGMDTQADWLEGFLSELEPPPWPGPLDQALARRGAGLFQHHCAHCHAPGGSREGTAIPLAEIGTDPAHVDTWDGADARRMNRITTALGLDGARMRGASGYVARPLVGVWLLAPYLHNGSVPTLRALLSPPAQRPAVFYRGLDVLDPESVGFLASGPEAEARGFRFDTRLPGNGNGGHAYGTALPAADRDALVEYLKTL